MKYFSSRNIFLKTFASVSVFSEGLGRVFMSSHCLSATIRVIPGWRVRGWENKKSLEEWTCMILHVLMLGEVFLVSDWMTFWKDPSGREGSQLIVGIILDTIWLWGMNEAHPGCWKRETRSSKSHIYACSILQSIPSRLSLLAWLKEFKTKVLWEKHTMSSLWETKSRGLGTWWGTNRATGNRGNDSLEWKGEVLKQSNLASLKHLWKS